MEQIDVLYNPFSHKNRGLSDARRIEKWFDGASFSYIDLTEKGFSPAAFIESCPEDHKIVLAGGDGTLNHLVNQLAEEELSRDLWFFPAGTGNDFAKDVGKKTGCRPFLLNSFISSLPKASINGDTVRFVNGVGFGLDGYACSEHERLKKLGKDSSYKLIAVKGLLFSFKPVSGTSTVDGEARTYKKLWMAPVMLGTYFGGGFPITPQQHRLNEERTLISVEVHDVGRLHAMLLFVPAMLGKGRWFKKHITYRKGHHFRAEFSVPSDLQCDGEVYNGVMNFTADYE